MNVSLKDDDEEGGLVPMEADEEDDEEEEGEGKEEKKKESEVKKESEIKQEKPEEEEEVEEEEEKKETPMEQEEEPLEEEEEEDDVDPLDAYMEGVKEEVKKFNMGGMRGNDKVRLHSEWCMIWQYLLLSAWFNLQWKKCSLHFIVQRGGMMVTNVTVVKSKKGSLTHKKKGELMINDQDAMEVSVPEY